MLRKRILAALLCLSLAVGLCAPARGAEASEGVRDMEERPEKLREDADGLEPYALETPAPGAAMAAPEARSGTAAYPVEGGNLYFDPETGEITDCDRSVTRAEIPEFIDGVRVTGIGDRAFNNCGSLTGVTIPNSVTSMGNGAFESCGSLETVTVPDGITSIGDDAFSHCYKLSSVTIPNSVTNIGKSAFVNCWALADVIIPNSVVSIGAYAFQGCESLTSVVIPNSVTSMGECPFSLCEQLEEIKVDIGNTKYKSVDGILFNAELTKLLHYPAKRTGQVYAVPDGVTGIADHAFWGCENLTSVTIPDSTMYIPPFYGCRQLVEIKVSPRNNEYTSVDGVLFYADKSELIELVCYPSGKTDQSYTIPDSVTCIGWRAFAYCSNLTSVIIPDSVTSFWEGAFLYCNGLTSVAIPGNMTSITDKAFGNCSGLTSVTIPDSVTSIGRRAFDDCKSLTDVYYGGTEAQWGAVSIDSGNDPLTSAVIHFGGGPLNAEEMFLIQSRGGRCTVAANAMMLRRRAYLNGEPGWEAITEDAVKPSAWIDGTGQRLSFSYEGKRVTTEGAAAQSVGEKTAYLISLLESHPEGVVAYYHGVDGPNSNSRGQHAVLLTDYDRASGTFYCADPAGRAPRGRIPLLESFIPGGTQDERIANIHQIWYISSNAVKKAAVSTTLRSDCPVEMRVTINGRSLNSSGVSGAVSNEYAAMTAAGAGQERSVEAAIDWSGVPEGSGIGVELFGTGEGSMTLTVIHTYSDGTKEQQVFKNVPVTAETVSQAENVRPQSTVLLSVTDSGTGEAEHWSVEPGEEAAGPSQDFVKVDDAYLEARLLESSGRRTVVQLTGGTLPENALVFAAHQEGGRFAGAALGTRSGNQLVYDCLLTAGDRLFILSRDSFVPLMGPAVEIM